MTETPDFHLNIIRHHLNQLDGIVAAPEKPVQPDDGSPRTFGRRDFSGYTPDVLRASIAILDGYGTLPGPLRLVQNSLKAALKDMGPPTKQPRLTTAEKAQALRAIIKGTSV